MILILMGMGIAGFLSRKLLLKTWRPLISVIDNLDYKSLTIAIIVFITTLVLISTGFWGLLILVAGSCLGLLPSILQVRKSQMMGLFLVPVLLFFSGYQDTVVSFFALEAQSSPPVNPSLSEISIFLLISVATATSSYFVNSRFQQNT
jgi:putative membrane protein